MASTITVGVLRALLTADTAQFNSGLREAVGSVKKFESDAKKLSANLGTLGKQMTAAVTLPIVATFGAAGKAAIDFESSFAGVRKTVDASEAEFKVLEQQFRDLAKTIPVNVNELNRLGEAAGALGIPKAEIAEFTKVMALLGVTTNVTSEQAANDIAKIQNIFGASGKNTEAFASALVDLGNKGASTEQEILALATRIASAGNTVGLSQDQVLGYAAAIANVGMEAEAGGSAFSRVIIDMSNAVSAGGDELANFARVAGMSAEAFQALFRQDAAAAFQQFVEGLGRIRQSGADVNTVLADLGVTELRQSDLLRRLSGDAQAVGTALGVSNQAWRDNTALSAEAEKRFATTSSELTTLWNRLTDIGITLGNALLPFIKSLNQTLADLMPYLESAAKWFSELPVPVQGFALGLAAVAAAAGPLLLLLSQLATGAAALAGLGGFAGITAAIGGLIPSWGTLVSAGAAVVTFFTTTLPAAFGATIAFLGPQGLIALAVVALGIVWYKWGDQISTVVKNVYTAVKTWLMDKLTEVWNFLKTKIDAVKGYFRGLYDAVVGNSYIPDMVDAIGHHMGRLDNLFVKPAQLANELVGIAFRAMTEVATKALKDLLGQITGIFGDITERVIPDFGRRGASAMSNLGTGFKNAFLTSFGAGLGEALGDLIGKGIEALANKLRGGEEGIIVNPLRDVFFAKHGGFEGLAKKLTDASDGNIAEQLLRVLYNADTKAAFDAAKEAIEDVLAAGQAGAGVAAAGSSPAQESMDTLGLSVQAVSAAATALQEQWLELARQFTDSVVKMTDALGDSLIPKIRALTAAVLAIPTSVTVSISVVEERISQPTAPSPPSERIFPSGSENWEGLGFQSFAREGIVSRPTLAMVGDAREPEWILHQSTLAKLVQDAQRAFSVGYSGMSPAYAGGGFEFPGQGRSGGDTLNWSGNVNVTLHADGRSGSTLARELVDAIPAAMRTDHSLVVKMRKSITGKAST